MTDLAIGMLRTNDVPAIVDGFKVVVLGTLPVMTGQNVSEMILVRLQKRKIIILLEHLVNSSSIMKRA